MGADLVMKAIIAIILGTLLVIGAAIINRKVEVYARNKYGPYK
jgi:tetrahydromethanopterin S-methyltransferase subunit E